MKYVRSTAGVLAMGAFVISFAFHTIQLPDAVRFVRDSPPSLPPERQTEL